MSHILFFIQAHAHFFMCFMCIHTVGMSLCDNVNIVRVQVGNCHGPLMNQLYSSCHLYWPHQLLTHQNVHGLQQSQDMMGDWMQVQILHQQNAPQSWLMAIHISAFSNSCEENGQLITFSTSSEMMECMMLEHLLVMMSGMNVELHDEEQHTIDHTLHNPYNERVG